MSFTSIEALSLKGCVHARCLHWSSNCNFSSPNCRVGNGMQTSSNFLQILKSCVSNQRPIVMYQRACRLLYCSSISNKCLLNIDYRKHKYLMNITTLSINRSAHWPAKLTKSRQHCLISIPICYVRQIQHVSVCRYDALQQFYVYKCHRTWTTFDRGKGNDGLSIYAWSLLKMNGNMFNNQPGIILTCFGLQRPENHVLAEL